MKFQEEVRMAKHRLEAFFICLFFLFNFALFSYAQTGLTAKDIVDKNIQAAGGKENLSRIKNYSFRSGPLTYYMSDRGVMKLQEGKEPIITEVILVDEKGARRNCFNKITELSGIQKSMYQALAKLRSGLFTLAGFKKNLNLEGLKSFGLEKHYVLSTTIGSLKVEFFIDSENFLLKRLVFKGFDPSAGKYEVNHDFGPYQELNGLKIPSSWFDSQVGARGRLNSISDLKLNQALEKGFFSRADVNIGTVRIGQGALEGNVVESAFQRNMLLVGTNWTDECMKRAGFNAEDKLILEIAGKEIEIDFYQSFPPRDKLGPGSKFIAPNTESENFIVYLVSPEYRELLEDLSPLLPIRVRKK